MGGDGGAARYPGWKQLGACIALLLIVWFTGPYWLAVFIEYTAAALNVTVMLASYAALAMIAAAALLLVGLNMRTVGWALIGAAIGLLLFTFYPMSLPTVSFGAAVYAFRGWRTE